MSIQAPPVWDLSDLYSGIDDPQIQSVLDAQMQKADEYAAKYRGNIDNPNLSASALCDAIQEYEDILQAADKPMDYAALYFSMDTSDPARGAFLQKMRECYSQISIKLMFFELELMAIPEDMMASIIDNPVLDRYRHFIHAARMFRDHRLSEPEERVMEEKANTGRRSFTRLFEETVSNITFHIEREGRRDAMSQSEIIALLRDPDRELRKAAAKGFTEGLVANGRTLTFIFNTILQDKSTDDRLRMYQFPEQSRHISNELDADTVELAVSSTVESFDIVARYYRIKREILGYDTLTHYDRYAPLFDTKEVVPFTHAKEIILNAFGQFSPTLSDTASKFFDENWIDAEVRKGKRGGAYCSYVTPDLHPYVFMNYLNRMDDVMTLGHELGHGVHAYLSRDKGYLNFATVLPVAELASTFGEMLVFEALQSEASLDDKLALYAEKIEGSFATIHRQAVMYRFEQVIHNHRRDKGELTTEEFSAYWQELQQEMFKDSVVLGDEHKVWWMYISHFISSPFYVYAYTFGELLVMALYAMYKKQGDDFPPKYVELLKTGGSMSPADMLSRVGIDIHDRAFWQGGLQILSEFVDDFEALYKEWKAK
ncbi:MAG: M3 family oligoendopeptidase [Armatimonadota bacterium]